MQISLGRKTQSEVKSSQFRVIRGLVHFGCPTMAGVKLLTCNGSGYSGKSHSAPDSLYNATGSPECPEERWRLGAGSGGKEANCHFTILDCFQHDREPLYSRAVNTVVLVLWVFFFSFSVPIADMIS